jgi:acyl-CoA thioester hydrolase
MFSYSRKAHYHETDQMGIIHHANYLKWMEEARVAFMEDLCFSYKRLEAEGIVSPVMEIGILYRRPVNFGDEVEIRLKITAYKGTRLELSYAFYELADGSLCTKATSKHCFLKDGRIISLAKEAPKLDEKLRALTEA